MFEQLSGELTPILGKLEATIETDLAEFNRLMTSHQLEPVNSEPRGGGS